VNVDGDGGNYGAVDNLGRSLGQFIATDFERIRDVDDEAEA
jgi:hypothetical protein